MRRPERLVLHGGIVLSGPGWRPRRADLLIEGPLLAAVTEPGALDGVDAAYEDLSGCLLMPGLVNAHMHSHNMVARGTARDWTLEASLLNASWMSGERSAELAGLCALLAGVECLASGAVGLFDLTAAGGLPDPEVMDAVAASYAELGLRARIAPMVADRSLHEAVPVLGACCGVAPWPTSSGSIVAACAALLSERPTRPGVDLALAPTIPTHCSTTLMTELRRLADRHGVPVHLHLAESRVQAISAAQRYRRSVTAELAAIGMLDGPLTAAHAVWVDDSDIELLARAGVRAVTVPGSNLRLGSGVAPVSSLLTAGVTVGIGTDGANSADLLDVLDAARLTTLVSRLSTADPSDWLSVEDTLDAATVGGLRACGWDDTGRIEPGGRADLTALDLSSAAFCPPNDLANQVLTAARAADVRHVMVGGRFRLRNGGVPGLDAVAARSRFCELAEEFLAGAAHERERAVKHLDVSSDRLARLRRQTLYPERLLRWHPPPEPDAGASPEGAGAAGGRRPLR
jgi:cytosine/adenosine deaminase-related metal-dependent hydrolase